MTDTTPPAAPIDPSAFEGAPAQLVPALIARGFTGLTLVQKTVLDPAYAGRDLRVSSKTGSGKTVALGFLIAPYLRGMASGNATPAAPAPAVPVTEATSVLPTGDDDFDVEAPTEQVPIPATAQKPGTRALVLAPTRELAVQVAGELRWLLADIGANVVVVTGGTSIALERRSLSARPEVIVGTPGRLLDHLEKNAIDASQVAIVVLDEADQMLDLGFRDDLIAILGKTPTTRRTHLVSATFSRAVMSLGAKYQKDPLSAEGTALGSANEDIAHVVHLVRAGEVEAALVNLLLLAEGERVLIFVRTRADTADLAERLVGRGFSARGISGDLEQRDRTRTLDAFRSGALTVLVATDVAARGLDVPDVGMVVHVGPPGDPESLTHRAGRTGRAGRKGVSVILANQSAGEEIQRLLSRARIKADVRPAPSAAEVQKAHDETLEAELKAPPASDMDARLRMLAARLLGDFDPMELVYALLARLEAREVCSPMPLTPVAAVLPTGRSSFRDRDNRTGRGGQGGGSFGDRDRGAASSGPGGGAGAGGAERRPRGDYTTFRITWGERFGANTPRILAVVCRRGGVTSKQVGAIRLGPEWSTFDIEAASAEQFFEKAGRPDPSEPRLRIDRFLPRGPARAALRR